MLIPIILVVIGIFLGIVVLARLYGRYMRDGQLTMSELYKLIASFFVIIVVFATIGSSITYVDVGHAQVVVDPLFGDSSRSKIVYVITGATWYLRAPWTNTVDVYYATDTFEDVIPCFSGDQLEMQIEVLIRWSLDASRIEALYRSYPYLNFKEKAIESIMEETIRLVTKNFTALETIEFRDYVTGIVELEVLSEIKEEPSLEQALIHLELDMKNIGYPANYTKEIEEKLGAEQRLLKAEYESQRIIILANASAQEIIIQSLAEQQSKINVANGTKQAIEMILSSVGGDPTNSTRIAELYLWFETLRRIAPDIDILIMSEGGVPIMPIVPDLNQTDSETP